MTFPRSAGILLHPTSLPGPHGIGEIGPEAHRFLDFLAEAGSRSGRCFRSVPTGYGDSPYQCFSAFAGNPLLIHVPGAEGDLAAGRTSTSRGSFRTSARCCTRPSSGSSPTRRTASSCSGTPSWLEDYALFMRAQGGARRRRRGRTGSPAPRSATRPRSTSWRRKLADAIERCGVEQYFFFTQFRRAQARAATERGIQLMGDLPIYVAHDSADVWANRSPLPARAGRHACSCRPACRRTTSARPASCGATRSTTGTRCARNGYAWWIHRMRAALRHVRPRAHRSLPRLRGLLGGAGRCDRRPMHGHWVPGTGARALRGDRPRRWARCPSSPRTSGSSRPEVEALREHLRLPGMSILQFAFGGDGQANEFQPHNVPARAGGLHRHARQRHDGRLVELHRRAATPHATPGEMAREKAYARRYLGDRRRRDALDADPRRARVRGQHGAHPDAGRARTRERGAHESPRSPGGQLEVPLHLGSAHPRHATRRLRRRWYDRCVHDR